jgi:hypothetical protein
MRMVFQRLLIIAALTVALPVVGRGQGPVGNEFQVNTITADDQFGPSACHDPLGNFVVVWTDDHYGGDAIFARRFTSAGAPLGTEFEVNTYTTGNQNDPAICCDDAGNFVVTWQSDEEDGDDFGIFGQRFSSTGTPVGTEFLVNSFTSDDQEHSDVCCGGDGSFVVVWDSDGQDGVDNGVFGQRYDSTGMRAGTEFQVNTYTDDTQEAPSICCQEGGDFVVVWESDQLPGTQLDVWGQRYASNGTPQGTEFQVSTYTTYDQDNPDVCCDGTGKFVVVWESYDQVHYDDIFGQRFDASGAPTGTEFQINTYTDEYQQAAEVCCDTAGDFVVVWHSFYHQDGSYIGVFGQRFSSSGAAQGPEFQVNSYTPFYQLEPDVSCADSGQFLVVWTGGDGQDGDEDGVFGRLFADQAGRLAAPAMSWAGLGMTALVLLGGAVRTLRRRARARRFD